MIYDGVEQMLQDLTSDLQKKNIRLRKKGAKLDAELYFMEKEIITDEIEEITSDLKDKISKTKSDLAKTELELSVVRKHMNGGACLDQYFPEIEKKLNEIDPDMDVKIGRYEFGREKE